MKANEESSQSLTKKRSLLLGVGLDKDDGERRVTVGANFLLVGGSKDTHTHMQEKAIKFNEELARRKKRFEDIGPEEFHDIADRVRLRE